MSEQKIAVLERVVGKLASLRQTLEADERAILDQMVLAAQPEVAFHAMEPAAEPAATPKVAARLDPAAQEVAFHAMEPAAEPAATPKVAARLDPAAQEVAFHAMEPAAEPAATPKVAARVQTRIKLDKAAEKYVVERLDI